MFINVVVLTANAIAMNLAKVTGTLSYPRFSPALGSEATIYITLVDVSPRQDSSGDIIVRLTIVKPTPSPIYFELKYNPAQIDRQHTYAIQARITERGKVIFTNNSPYPVITGGNPHKVDIVLTPKQLP
ncbi:YbaY family lipoprotein [Synechocystis sp. PCC 7509]|uniref:YbaY family lipoprotein n=1 Tax=Synechocystis sp. PCC 7509 TaxID=927677 RepID=UPI0002ACE13C|nr:YbaY family lipoprotein [Synechocystis sp. PCC 7509]